MAFEGKLVLDARLSSPQEFAARDPRHAYDLVECE